MPAPMAVATTTTRALRTFTFVPAFRQNHSSEVILMTTEEIEVRKVIKELLSDVGINRETLKQMVKDILEEKIKKAIKDALLETKGGATIEEKLEDYARNYIQSWEFKNVHRQTIAEIIKAEMKDLYVEVNLKSESNK